MKALFEDAKVARLDRKLGGYAVFFLTALGIWLILGPLVPSWSGYGALADRLGGETNLLRGGLAILFLYFAGIVREKNELRHSLHGMIEIINRQLYGEDYREVRETVDALIRGLASSREELREQALKGLRELTGEDHGPEAGAWERWWTEKRSTFGRARPGGSAPGGGRASL